MPSTYTEVSPPSSTVYSERSVPLAQKHFQDGMTFEFQDGTAYQFNHPDVFYNEVSPVD